MNEPTWIDQNSPSQLKELLQKYDVLGGRDVTSVSIAGEGNMNVTLRVTLAAGDSKESIIVKQSRPFVAKYDSIPAPLERIEFEAKFYDFVEAQSDLKSKMPRRLAWIPEEKVLVLEDLGAASDATSLYAKYPCDELPSCIGPLVDWLALLHQRSRDEHKPEKGLNSELRKLNHEHIFSIPFNEPSAIDLDDVCSGLAKESLPIRTDEELRSKAKELGGLYLGDGPCLLHGDFYPGSWLMTDQGPMVIDPEFMFWGPAEFDLGVLVAHLQFVGVQEPIQKLEPMWGSRYQNVDLSLVRRFAAIEILRRLLGVAQLPLSMNLDARIQLINAAGAELTQV